MNEREAIPEEGGDSLSNVEDNQSVGYRLAQARSAASLTHEEVAARLCLRVRVIQSLEEDDYSELGGVVFARGYLRAYAKLLALQPDELVLSFNRHYGEACDFDTPSLHQRPRSRNTLRWQSLGKRVLLSSLAMLIIAVASVAIYRHNMGSRERLAQTTTSQLETATAMSVAQGDAATGASASHTLPEHASHRLSTSSGKRLLS